MKYIKKRWLGLAIAPFALAFFAMAQPALANNCSGNCANYPNLKFSEKLELEMTTSNSERIRAVAEKEVIWT